MVGKFCVQRLYLRQHQWKAITTKATTTSDTITASHRYATTKEANTTKATTTGTAIEPIIPSVTWGRHDSFGDRERGPHC